MSGKPSHAPLASEPMSTALADLLATATCMCCANFGTKSQSRGATKLAVGKFEAEGDIGIGMALSHAPAYLPWVRENRSDWVWSRDCSMSVTCQVQGWTKFSGLLFLLLAWRPHLRARTRRLARTQHLCHCQGSNSGFVKKAHSPPQRPKRQKVQWGQLMGYPYHLISQTGRLVCRGTRWGWRCR